GRSTWYPAGTDPLSRELAAPDQVVGHVRTDRQFGADLVNGQQLKAGGESSGRGRVRTELGCGSSDRRLTTPDSAAIASTLIPALRAATHRSVSVVCCAAERRT